MSARFATNRPTDWLLPFPWPSLITSSLAPIENLLFRSRNCKKKTGHWVDWVVTKFHWVFIGFYWVSLDFHWFYWVLLGFTGFSLGFTGFYWALLGFTGFY